MTGRQVFEVKDDFSRLKPTFSGMDSGVLQSWQARTYPHTDVVSEKKGIFYSVLLEKEQLSYKKREFVLTKCNIRPVRVCATKTFFA